MEAIFHRTSIRKFEDKAVEQEKLEKLLRAAMQAPTAGNQRSWEFYVVRNKEVLSKLSTVSPYAGPVKNAPLAIVVANRKEAIMPEYNDIDAAIACENIWLEADELGLGGVMLGIAPHQDRVDAVDEILGISESLQSFAIMALGYPVKVAPQKDRYEEARIHYVD